MWNKEKRKNTSHKLSREILKIFVLTFFIALLGFYGLNELANVIVLNYVENEMLVLTEYQLIDIQYGILGVSFVAACILFLVLFLSMVAERLAYIEKS